jgi:mRNA interferase MazF
MTRCRPGDVVLVRFPFTDLSSTKKRPALVLSPPRYTVRQRDVVVLALTSQPQKQAALRLSQWKAAGLPKPTWVKPVVGTLASALIVRRLGRLNAADRQTVRYALGQLIAPEFLS